MSKPKKKGMKLCDFLFALVGIVLVLAVFVATTVMAEKHARRIKSCERAGGVMEKHGRLMVCMEPRRVIDTD